VTGFRKKGKWKNNVQKASSFLKAINQALKGRYVLTTGVSPLRKRKIICKKLTA